MIRCAFPAALTLCALSSCTSTLPVVAVSSVQDRPIRVLYVEGSPCFEYRFLSNLLTRSKGITAQVWLAPADKGWKQPSTKGTKPLERLPSTFKELKRYDVVLIGNVEGKDLEKALLQYTRGGGGLGLLSGEKITDWNPGELLPVVLDKKMGGFGRGFSRDLPIGVPATAKLHPILRLGKTDEESRRIWAALRIRHSIPIKEAKKRATVLLTCKTGTKTTTTLASVSGLGAGRVFHIATDDTWLWRRQAGGYHERFWRNVVRYLAGRQSRKKAK
jgi:hypothetical protein